jgi:tetratricopeptide (TPR) repeat protein
MFNELSKKENNFVELISLLDSNSGAAFEKISDYLHSINELNLSLLTYIISKHQNKSSMFALLKELFKKFPDNSDVIKQYGLFLDHFNNTEEAIKLFKSKFEIIKSDPSALLYLAMFNLKSNLIEDALNLLNEIEKEFKTWNDILIRVRTIKDKLQSSVRV